MAKTPKGEAPCEECGKLPAVAQLMAIRKLLEQLLVLAPLVRLDLHERLCRRELFTTEEVGHILARSATQIGRLVDKGDLEAWPKKKKEEGVGPVPKLDAQGNVVRDEDGDVVYVVTPPADTRQLWITRESLLRYLLRQGSKALHS